MNKFAIGKIPLEKQLGTLQAGTRQMIELLSRGSREGWDWLRSAVEEALSLGCQDVAAIRHLLLAGRMTKPNFSGTADC